MSVINKVINVKNFLNNTLILVISLIYSYFIVTPKTISFGVGNITVNLLLLFLILLACVNAKKIVNSNKKMLILFFVEIILIIFSYLSNNSGYGSVVAVITFLLIFFVSPTIDISKKTLIKCLIVFSAFWIYSLTVNYTLYDVNTNNASASVFYLCILIINLLLVLVNNSKLKKLSIISAIVITVSNIFKYESRTVILILLFLAVTIFFDFSRVFIKKVKFKMLISWFIVTIGSLLVTILYMEMYKSNYSLNLSFISKKNFFTGREVIWSNLYSIFKDYWSFGIGSKSYYFPHQGAHNYMLSVLVLFGLPHFMIFISIIYDFFKKIFKKNINKCNCFCLFSIICLFITEFFEASFIGGQKLVTLFLLSVIFFNIKNETGDLNEKD